MADTPQEKPKDHGGADGFEFLKHLGTATSAIGVASIVKLLAASGVSILNKLLGSFAEKTGEKISATAADYIGLRIWGVKSEDERRFNDARNLLEDNDRTRLSKRLAKLTSEQSDWYRITVMQDTPEKIANTLEKDARMTDDEWDRWAHVMNLDQSKVETTWQTFLKWLQKDGQKALTEATQSVRQDTLRLRGVREGLEQKLAAKQHRANRNLMTSLSNWWEQRWARFREWRALRREERAEKRQYDLCRHRIDSQVEIVRVHEAAKTDRVTKVTKLKRPRRRFHFNFGIRSR